MTHNTSSKLIRDKTLLTFNSVKFIMVKPSHPGNVGSTARAIKTMGFKNLVLVDPYIDNVTSHPDAVALASGAIDVLQHSTMVHSLQEALADTTYSFALTARARFSGPPPINIRDAALYSTDHICYGTNNKVGFVLGTERAGLSNQDTALCQRTCHIPANNEYSSLNVAQAAQLVAWELRYSIITALNQNLLPSTNGAPEKGSEPATNKAVQDLLVHLEEALLATGFLDPEHPKKLMEHMVRIFTRCGLSRNETNMLRGMCSSMINPKPHNNHKNQSVN